MPGRVVAVRPRGGSRYSRTIADRGADGSSLQVASGRRETIRRPMWGARRSAQRPVPGAARARAETSEAPSTACLFAAESAQFRLQRRHPPPLLVPLGDRLVGGRHQRAVLVVDAQE